MLKNKKYVYILLPIVVLVWGILVYKIIGALNPEPLEVNPTSVSKFKTPKKKERDTFSITQQREDPFLGKVYAPKTHTNQKSLTKNNAQEIQWPHIQYLGTVSGSKSKTAIYILQVNGKQFLLTKDESVEGITLYAATPSSVKLRYKNATQTFHLK